MYPTTLRGVFPERPPPIKRNFIRENVLRIRELHDATESHELRAKSDAKLGPKVPRSKSLSKLRMSEKTSKSQSQKPQQMRRPGMQKLDIRPGEDRPLNISDLVVNNNVSHRSVQTSNLTEDVSQSQHQVSPHAGTNQRKLSSRRHGSGHGDTQDFNPAPPAAKGSAGQKGLAQHRVDYIRSNIIAARQNRPVKKTIMANASTNSEPVPPPPPTHKHKKSAAAAAAVAAPKPEPELEETRVEHWSFDCPPGHVLLPEEERRETLRVLRESYAEKIQEMNSMPVRSDTLRMQKRKMTLETELQKIDEGIKIFQRPKVFVKVDV